MAALLRAPRRAGAAGARVRGHPLGRRGARRLRRVPARLGQAPPHLRAHAGTARRSPTGTRASPARCAARRRSRWSRCGDEAMDELLTGLVPGLPDDVRHRLREAADGIPLFAVETVRMLRDRGAPRAGRRRGRRHRRPLGARGARRPCTRSSPRGSTACRRRSAGCSRTPRCSARRSRDAGSRRSRGSTSTTSSLWSRASCAGSCSPSRPIRSPPSAASWASCRRSCSGSPTRRSAGATAVPGTSPRRASSPRTPGIDPDEIAEVIASHYLDAHAADPDAADRDDVRAEARRWFTRAAERAASLAASLEAQRAFERAAELAGEARRPWPLARAGR